MWLLDCHSSEGNGEQWGISSKFYIKANLWVNLCARVLQVYAEKYRSIFRNDYDYEKGQLFLRNCDTKITIFVTNKLQLQITYKLNLNYCLIMRIIFMVNKFCVFSLCLIGFYFTLIIYSNICKTSVDAVT